MPDSKLPEQRKIKIESGNYNERIERDYIQAEKIYITNYYHSQKDVTSTLVNFTDAISENLHCPYRGLFHFGPNDAEYFFGRKVFIEELFAATQTRNFIPVLGASGSGKSSVVLAGLVPKLQNEGHWLFTHFRPGSDPFHALALALVPLYTLDFNATERIAQARQLAKYLHDGDVLLADVFAQIHQNHHAHRVLLIADQFEELYTLCADRKIRCSFLDTLLPSFQSSSQPQHRNVLVTTMRADFLGNALSYRPLADVLQNTDIKLGQMNHEELEEVIVKPAEKLGVTFQDGLVKRILNNLDSEPGSLPLLEFSLAQLWKLRKGKQLTHAAYEEIGEVKGALARHADENYGNLNRAEQEQVQRIFIQLVRPGEGTEDTRRLATKGELGKVSWRLVKQLADARLVVTSRNAVGQETAEVVHETLIRNWGELRQWMETHRSFRAWQERLRVAIYQWEQMNRDEGALLQGALLSEAENWWQNCLDEISQSEREFIQISLELRDRITKQEEERFQKELRQQKAKTRFILITAALTVIALLTAVTAWQQYKQAQFSKVLALAADGFPKPELLPVARDLLNKANNIHDSAKNNNEVEEALSNYRAVINLTSLLEENKNKISVNQNLLKELSEDAEKKLVQLIRKKRLNRLQKQIENNLIGNKVTNMRTKYAENYTEGALKTTYRILHEKYGVKADIDSDGQLKTDKEAKRMPCDILIEIEKLWKQNHGCTWSESCNAIPDEQNLIKKIFYFPKEPAELRLNNCGINTE
ncbi:MAG: hypothetical protein AAF208_10695 [Cyanobacteria bacterium P01_A01_bin.45]